MMMAGARLRCSRMFSVIAPKPIEVKKLIENLVFLGLSIGNMFWRYISRFGSLKRSVSFFKPIPSSTSWNMILMKIRDDEVVSSSFILTVSSTVHGIASVASW